MWATGPNYRVFNLVIMFGSILHTEYVHLVYPLSRYPSKVVIHIP